MNVENNADLSRLSRLRIGGTASFLGSAHNHEELCFLLAFAGERGVPVMINGAGSNTAWEDGHWQGMVVRLTDGYRKIDVEEHGQVVRVKAGGAVMLPKLAQDLAAMGLVEIAHFVGVPGTVGGGVFMNAGTTRGGNLGDYVTEVELLRPGTRELVVLPADALAFSYRSSSLQAVAAIVTSVTFSLKAADAIAPALARERIRSILTARAERQPEDPWTLGSTFRAAPDGTPAGKLLEAVGMKGFRVGDVLFSPKHANWLINAGAGKCSEVRAVVDEAQKRVSEAFGVRLHREIRMLPHDGGLL